ncbi:BIRC7_8 [Mytilus coruscus]|uniref:BIRC7_8 n=1 Tax=Mytilus coruscus TaxID=42192 RepID=A0A6J8DHE9_MYTCO|nr:BIRC7_8 [Mytilus coruscus]
MFSFNPVHPTKLYYIDREQTFENWPRQIVQKPQHLIQNGFFYTGIGDRVTCFYCGVTVKQWEASDCVETEHQKWEPNFHHPSQVQHTYLMWNELEHLEMHFEEALSHIDHKAVRTKWQEEMKKLEQSDWISCHTIDISEHARDTFLKLFDDVEWCKKNLPNQIDYTRTYKTNEMTASILSQPPWQHDDEDE